MYTLHTINAVVVHCGCSALQLFLAYNLRKKLKISKFTLDYIVQYIAVS